MLCVHFVKGKDMFRLFLILSFVTSVAFAQDGNQGNDTLYTDSTNRSTVDSTSTTTVYSPPPSAIAPSINSSNSDLCTVGVSGAVQTQILGLSAGKTVRDMNCERLKNAKTLYDMGMKVAAVATMCGDRRVFDAMMNAGTPCPYDGLIGNEAKLGWENDPGKIPGNNGYKDTSNRKPLLDLEEDEKSTLFGGGVVGGLLLLLLL